MAVKAQGTRIVEACPVCSRQDNEFFTSYISGQIKVQWKLPVCSECVDRLVREMGM